MDRTLRWRGLRAKSCIAADIGSLWRQEATTATRSVIESKGVMPSIPPKGKRRPILAESLSQSQLHRVHVQPQDFRRGALGYDCKASNFLADLRNAVIVSYWLWFRSLDIFCKIVSIFLYSSDFFPSLFSIASTPTSLSCVSLA